MREAESNLRVGSGPAPFAAGQRRADAPPLLGRFFSLYGDALRPRTEALCGAIAASPRGGKILSQRHALELALGRMLESGRGPQTRQEARIAALGAGLVSLRRSLSASGRTRLADQVAASLSGRETLAPLLYRVHLASLQRSRGFMVRACGLEDGAPFDFTLQREEARAELAVETVSADDGRDLHRSAWFDLVDGIDPDLQTWLSAHPGRYLLKMTLPKGLREPGSAADGLATLAALQGRIRDMLATHRRADHDEAMVIRLDPLLLAGAQAGELGLLDALREQFGPEAQLAVTRSGKGLFVMAARAGRENRVGAAVRERLVEATPRRFTGRVPGIVSIFLEDTDRAEWLLLRQSLSLEGEARQFLTCAAAAPLVAVTAATRIELLDADSPHSARDGELRFRNQAHRDAKSALLAPAISSCC